VIVLPLLASVLASIGVSKNFGFHIVLYDQKAIPLGSCRNTDIAVDINCMIGLADRWFQEGIMECIVSGLSVKGGIQARPGVLKFRCIPC
jgi:hypothetical protein